MKTEIYKGYLITFNRVSGNLVQTKFVGEKGRFELLLHTRKSEALEVAKKSIDEKTS